MSTEAPPRVSVICPVWNAAEIIQPTLNALARQSERSYEVVFVDDASNDSSAELIRSQGNVSFRVFSLAENQGHVAARNRAIALARGDYIAVNDQDDLPHPDRLKLQRAVLDQNQGISGVCSLIETIDASGHRIPGVADWGYSRQEAKVALVFHNFVTHSTLMFRRPSLGELTYDPHWPVCEDYRLLARLAFEGEGIVVLRRRLVAWRAHSGNQTHLLRHEMVQSSRRLRAELLLKWGVTPTEYEWTLHDAFEKSPEQITSGFLGDCADWLLSFRQMNARQGVVPDRAARAVLHRLWFEFANKHARMGRPLLNQSIRMSRHLSSNPGGLTRLIHLGSKVLVRSTVNSPHRP